jgi:hypothetical protein
MTTGREILAMFHPDAYARLTDQIVIAGLRPPRESSRRWVGFLLGDHLFIDR